MVQVRVDHVELVRALERLLQHHDVTRDRLGLARVEPQRARAAGYELRAGARVTGGEQGQRVALGHQRLGQPRHHALGSAVAIRRNGFVQRRDLCDAHGSSDS